MSVDISPCSWPIPDETSKSGHIEECCSFVLGCWQCTPQEYPCWCYMTNRWKQWGLEPGQVTVKTDLSALKKRIERGYQLKSNLGMCSSHDPLHKEALPVFRRILDLFFEMGTEASVNFWNGHTLHICTKHPMRLTGIYRLLDDKLIWHRDTDSRVKGLHPRVWTSITTPSDEQAREYMADVDSPFDMALALHSLIDFGFDDLGVSFGPCFGAWRDWDRTREYLDTLPPLRMAQFEQMNHGNDQLDILTYDEVEKLARIFKEMQPECKVYLKTSAFNVGRRL